MGQFSYRNGINVLKLSWRCGYCLFQSDRIVSQMCSTLEGKLQNYGKLVDSSTPSDAMVSKEFQ